MDQFWCYRTPNKRTIYSVGLSPNLQNRTHVSVNFMWNYRKLCVSAQQDDRGIENLTAAIENYVETAPRLQMLPDVDEIVLAPYEGSYYRAVVKAAERGFVRVEFLDYGDEACAHFDELIQLNEEINEHPIYSVTFTLSDLRDDLSPIDSPIFDRALMSGGYLVVESMSRFNWSGQLWLPEYDITWGNLVMEVLSSQEAADTSSDDQCKYSEFINQIKVFSPNVVKANNNCTNTGLSL